MKMKFALLLLPALMALSSCGAAAQPVAEKTFLEDTTAHSEIFGGNDVVGGQLQIKNRAKNEPISAPKIGYQIRYTSEGDKLAIRFVAAIKEFNVKAYWRRGVAGANGNDLQSKSFANAAREVTKYYTSLSDGNTTITAGEGDFADYTGFVVYSIYNIPYTENEDAYVAAYVNLVGDEDGDSEIHNNSQGLAVKIEKKSAYESNNVFTFDPTVTGHFLEGTIGGVLYNGGANGLYRESAGTPDGNEAWYEKVRLNPSDSFGSFYYEHDTTFQYCGYDMYFDNADCFNESSLSGFASPKKEGKYNLYVSTSTFNHIFDDRFYEVTFYANTTDMDAWGDVSGYFIHAFNGGTSYTGEFGVSKMSLVTEHHYSFVLEMADGNTITGVIFGGYQGGDAKQTQDISCSISDTGAYDINRDGTWTDGKMNATISAHV